MLTLQKSVAYSSSGDNESQALLVTCHWRMLTFYQQQKPLAWATENEWEEMALLSS